MIADQSLGLALGEQLKLGKDTYAVVGIAQGMVSSGGDGIAFFTVRDAQAVQFDLPGEAIRMERAARVRRGAAQDVGRVQPLLLERGGGPSSAIPALGPAMVSAITVRLAAGVDPLAVAETISGWPDVSVHTQAGQRELLVYGMIDKARRQIGLFRVLLVIISTIIMALILYTLTLDKIHDIALLKLMGARNSMIVGLILQQALLLGLIGYGIAYWLGQWVFPKFPRRVLIGARRICGDWRWWSRSFPCWRACSASGRRCASNRTRCCHDDHGHHGYHPRRRSHRSHEDLWQRQHRSRGHEGRVAACGARRSHRAARSEWRGQIHAAYRDWPHQSAHRGPHSHRRRVGDGR
jgi:hypothetical protein